MIVVGLTGAPCSGKTQVLSLFKKCGAYTLNSDNIVRSSMKKGEIGYKKIIKSFGRDILDSKGRILRRTLRKIVFEKKQNLKKVESILHPIVKNKILSSREKFRKTDRVIVVEVPLLFEKNFNLLTDVNICVSVNSVSQKKYAKKRSLSLEVLNEFSKRQMPLPQKKKKADFVIQNNGNLRDLNKKVSALYTQLIGGKK